jgi:hypothetical protein
MDSFSPKGSICRRAALAAGGTSGGRNFSASCKHEIDLQECLLYYSKLKIYAALIIYCIVCNLAISLWKWGTVISSSVSIYLYDDVKLPVTNAHRYTAWVAGRTAGVVVGDHWAPGLVHIGEHRIRLSPEQGQVLKSTPMVHILYILLGTKIRIPYRYRTHRFRFHWTNLFAEQSNNAVDEVLIRIILLKHWV